MRETRESLGRRSESQVAAISDRVLNRLCKWRSVFAGWQLGTRLDTDAESRAVRDHREVTMLMRVELNALTACLAEAGLITARDFTEQVIIEAEELEARFEAKFPGFTATDVGMNIDLRRAAKTMEGWRP